MKLFRYLSLIPLTICSVFPSSANEYKFEEIKFDQESKEYEIFFVKHAIVHRKMLRYNW